ncbi:hypothetical protein [Williamsia phyllosphaerae]|uniref:Uncharacterized protein n=1 Tax=Williamsia phyllosphaerae TaxID=885042 RepID=A0ABQ1V7A5_9NOCA|nr:hypothetical protein [Williamsia phyllosphaerae]GGF38832.1 hypothetical protein GCM10007298_38180 [Williamsia phyllosphaerae]
MSAAFMQTLCNWQHFVEHADDAGLTWSLLHNSGFYELRLFDNTHALPFDMLTGTYTEVAEQALHALAVGR